MGRRNNRTPSPSPSPSPRPGGRNSNPRNNGNNDTGYAATRGQMRAMTEKKLDEAIQELLLEYALYQDAIRQVLGMNQALNLQSWAQKQLEIELGIQNNED